MLTVSLGVVTGLIVLLLIKELAERRRKAQRLPPGPQSLAEAFAKVGPKAPQWLIFDALNDDYGE